MKKPDATARVDVLERDTRSGNGSKSGRWACCSWWWSISNQGRCVRYTGMLVSVAGDAGWADLCRYLGRGRVWAMFPIDGVR